MAAMMMTAPAKVSAHQKKLRRLALSGTTLIAAEKTGRRGRAIEYEPKYVDVGVRRWERFTGRQAVLAATGEPFEEVESARASARDESAAA